MKYDLPNNFPITSQALTHAITRLSEVHRPLHQRLWTYYRNPMTGAAITSPSDDAAERPYRQGQEWGLPSRITGYLVGDNSATASRASGIARKEVVIENDIAWRIEAMIDHLFGAEVLMESTAPDEPRRRVLTRILDAAFRANGGLSLLQELAMLGAVFGFVDLIVKLDTAAAIALRNELGGNAWNQLLRGEVRRGGGGGGDGGGETEGETSPATPTAEGSNSETGDPGTAAAVPPIKTDGIGAASLDHLASDTGPGNTPDGQLIERLARLVRFEIVHPSRSLPLPSLSGAYAQTWEEPADPVPTNPSGAERRRWWHRRDSSTETSNRTVHLELLTPTHWYRFADGVRVAQGHLSLGVLPVVHIQNVATPFEYAGRSDVEPLIPLQDELNTRLSDRAYRITMQSFKMFLGKGIDNFLTAPVGPGRMWATDNEEAEIKEFGGDQSCPSEDAHISDIREALDKTSGVPPVAAGTIRDRIGSLSSAAALRVTLQALMAKTERKRATYGQGLSNLASLTLAWLSAASLLPTTDNERHIEINWPSALPQDGLSKLHEAQIKANLGVPKEILLREIGY